MWFPTGKRPKRVTPAEAPPPVAPPEDATYARLEAFVHKLSSESHREFVPKSDLRTWIGGTMAVLASVVGLVGWVYTRDTNRWDKQHGELANEVRLNRDALIKLQSEVDHGPTAGITPNPGRLVALNASSCAQRGYEFDHNSKVCINPTGEEVVELHRPIGAQTPSSTAEPLPRYEP